MNNDEYLKEFEENHGQYTSLEDLERAKAFLLSALTTKEEEARQAERERLAEAITNSQKTFGIIDNQGRGGAILVEDVISLLRDK